MHTLYILKYIIYKTHIVSILYVHFIFDVYSEKLWAVRFYVKKQQEEDE